MSLVAVRDAMVAAIKTALPPAVSVAAHAGRFDEAELARYAVASPTVLVACLGVVGVSARGGEVAADVLWGAFVVAGPGKRGVAPQAVALALLPPLLACIAGNRWGREEAETHPEALKADNLYSAKLDGNAVALWAASWRQRITIGGGLTQEELDALPDFLSCGLTQADHGGTVLDETVFPVRPADDAEDTPTDGGPDQ